MRKSTEEILEEIRLERERRVALTRAELEKSYEELLKSGCETGKLLDFTADLAGSKQIEYHYELVLEDWKRKKENRLYIDDSFAVRRKEGRDFLFPLMDVKDEFESVHIAYLIAQSFRGFGRSVDPEREKLAPYLIRYAELSSPELRRLAIIAIGWIYAPSSFQAELECLSKHLIGDEDSLCRAWSASAFMQLCFHDAPIEAVKEASLPAFRQCIATESDVFALGVAITSMKELWKLKVRLSDAAVDRQESDMIEKARKRVLKLLEEI